MIVRNNGYIGLEGLIELVNKKTHFAVYKTHKDTYVLLHSFTCLKYPIKTDIYQPQMDRLPWKETEGKRIATLELVFDSKVNPIDEIEFNNWNNGNQIMTYVPYSL